MNRINYSIRLSVEFFAPVLLFGGTLAIYLWSMPRTVVLEDDGLFLLTAYYNGIAHPPGYPLYMLLSHVATWMPVGTVAERVHGFTALIGALCCVALYHVIRKLLSENSYALIGSSAFGFSLAFWSQTIIAEVYSLNVLIILVLFGLSLDYARSPEPGQRQHILNWMGLLYGLGLSNHWPLLVLSTPIFLAVLWPFWRKVLRQFPRGTLFGLLGLVPYVWMVWRSQANPLISFYGPIESWKEFWFFISRQMYAEVEHSPTAAWIDKLLFFRFAIEETARQFTYAGILPILVGFQRQWRQWRWPIASGLTLTYVANTFLLIGLLDMDYDFFNRSNFQACPLVAYAVCSIWLALGLKNIVDFLLRSMQERVRPELIKGLAGLLFAGTPLMANSADNFRARDTWTEDYAKVVLESLDKDAVLFTFGDTSVWTIGYVHHVLGIRPDVRVYNMKGTVFSNRLFKPYTLPFEQVEKRVEQFIKTTEAPVYFTANIVGNFGEIDFGLYKQVDKTGGRESQRAVILPRVRQYFETLLTNGEPVDNSEKMHYQILTALNCLQTFRMARAGSLPSDQVNELNAWNRRICTTFQGKMLQISYLLVQGFRGEELLALLKEAESLRNQAIASSELLQLAEYRTRIYQAESVQEK